MTRTWSFIRAGTSADTGSEPRRWSRGAFVKTSALGLPRGSKLGVRENRLLSMGTSCGERLGHRAVMGLSRTGRIRTNATVCRLWLVPVVRSEGMQLVDGVLQWNGI